MRFIKHGLRSVPAQILLSSVLLLLLAAIVVGVLALWFIRGQLERQAWSQVAQGGRAAQALYASQQREIAGWAALIAQRPTLEALWEQGDWTTLSSYLHTLRANTPLDAIMLCEAAYVEAQPGAVAQVGPMPGDVGCMPDQPSGFRIVSEPAAPGVPVSSTLWVWAVAPHSVEETQQAGWVGVGLLLDDAFVAQMRDQTGLEHTLLVRGQPLFSSLPGRHKVVPHLDARQAGHRHFSVATQEGGATHSYYALAFPLHNSELAFEVAMPVDDVLAARRRLLWFILSSGVVVVLLGSLLGAFMAQRISEPLGRLAEAAISLNREALGPSLLEEVQEGPTSRLLAETLEGARVDLLRTLEMLRMEKAWADHLLEAVVEGIVTLDRYGHITFFSPGAERITGWAGEEVVGQLCDDIFRVVGTEKTFVALMPPPGGQAKISVSLRDGRQAILAVTGARLLPPGGDEARVALVFRDISEEETMHRLMGHFMANVAHEFRTPLSALAASVELLMDQVEHTDIRSSPGEYKLRNSEIGLASPDALVSLLTSLHLGVLGLQTLVDNLLEGASIESGHFRIYARPCDLPAIIVETMHMMKPLLEKHQQRLSVDLPEDLPQIYADPRRTVQVLVNLISNASKYGPDSAGIDLRVSLEPAYVRVSVSDRGPGIPDTFRKDLFRRFARADGQCDSEARIGVGLGLSVTKAIIEAQGGQIGFEDRQGGGACFWFTIPVVNYESACCG